MGKQLYAFGFFALMLGASCSPEARLASLLRKHPELVRRDTVFRADTIIVHGVQADTIFKNEITRDTVIIRQDHLTIKYFNSRDSIFISGKCDSIIRIVKVPVEVNTIEIKALSGWDLWWNKSKDYLIASLLGIVLVLLLLQNRFGRPSAGARGPDA